LNKKNESGITEAITTKIIKYLEDGSIIGLGSGSTVTEFIKSLSRQAKEAGLRFAVISSSLQIRLVAEKLDLNILPQNMIPRIDVTVDGADQIDEEFNMIKGGGGALFRERVLLGVAKKRIILADETKYVKKLCRPIPVEVSTFARSSVYEKLVNEGGKPILRLLDKGYPYISENGNIIFDTDLGIVENPKKTRSHIMNIAGVIESGIFVGEGDIFYKANQDGSLQTFEIH
jgi:ribose 5-phosphate isomerase A